MIKFDVILNETINGEYQNQTVRCEICNKLESVAIIFNNRICSNCLSIARTCILREAGKAAGLTDQPPIYKEMEQKFGKG